MTSNEPAIERAIAGYREIVETLSATHPPEFPDPSVTMAQMRVLMLLGVIGEARMSDLAPQLGISLSTLSSLVDRLVDAGFVVRRTDERDRRSVIVSLTHAGTDLLDSFQELGADHLRKILVHLTDSEIETVNQAIDVLVTAARRISQEEPS
jgi:DNA-binding MarR family transcriptional regulator